MTKISRRAVLLGTLATAGCAGASETARPGPTTSSAAAAPPSTPPVTPSATQTPSPTPSLTQTPARAPLPSLEEITQRYAGRTPSEWGTDVSGVVSRLDDRDGSTGSGSGVALTFDACGGGGEGDGYDAALIDLLRDLEVPATLFLNARWILAHPSLAAELADDPLFLVACHGNRHVPLSVQGRDAYGIRGTASIGEVYQELTGNVDWFVEHTGAPPLFTRPGTAHQDDVAAAIAVDLGMPIAGFSVNGDGGATFSAGQVRDTLLTVGPGDIVLAHLNRPGGGTAEGCAQAVPPLLERGVEFVTLA
ncbi:MAG: polysaccharide deacetylase family protein [Actinomycetia bacterium]|nr:polysaccharide deacetylase family protein [Actinomycetes bacterium]